MMPSLTMIGVAVLIYVTAGFALSVYLKRNDIADVMWGPGILLAAMTALFTSGHTLSSAPLAYLICAFIGLWAIRIAWQIGSRFLSKSVEDTRYAQWRTSWRYFYIRSYFQVFLLQGILMILVSMVAIATTLYAAAASYPTLFVFSGSLVFLFGLTFEAIADEQLNAFIKSKIDKSDILSSGLWYYSRHPNYFGEVTAWWGLWIIAVAPTLSDPTAANVIIALVALIAPVTITTLILKVSGIPMLEAKYVGNTKFEAYKLRTSAFFPWFPRSAEPTTNLAPALPSDPRPNQSPDQAT
jgi:steroid 5-alpha reductase family enzyme